jgi:hypothetical protein
MAARMIKSLQVSSFGRDLGVEALPAQLIINRRLAHERTP